MGIPELLADIAYCNSEIDRIAGDILKMEIAKKNVGDYAAVFQEQKETVEAFDMTVGDTWKEELCTIAQEKQKAVVDGIVSAKGTCDTAAEELQACINEAYRRIDEFKARIQKDNDEIRRIEEEEEARRKANPECYRCD